MTEKQHYRPSGKERTELRRRVVKLYRQGYTLEQVADEIGRSVSLARTLLVEAGVERRGRGANKTERFEQLERIVLAWVERGHASSSPEDYCDTCDGDDYAFPKSHDADCPWLLAREYVEGRAA